MDVTSWRRMTVYDLRLPQVIAEALLRTSYTDITGPQGDSFDQNALQKIMQKFDRSETGEFGNWIIEVYFNETNSIFLVVKSLTCLRCFLPSIKSSHTFTALV